jgi:hypothetical protein
MHTLTKRFSSISIALFLTLALLAPGIDAVAANVTYTKEKLPEFETQLSGGQIQAATLNKRVRSMRLTLKNGEHKLVIYEKKGSPALIAKLQAKHIPVTILSKAEAEKEAKEKPKHHKIRYIVGGVLIAVIVIVGAVLLIRRGRRD